MQFGKLYINSALELSEAEFYETVKGKDIGGIDKKEAYKLWISSKPKVEKPKKNVVKEEESL